MTELKTSQNNKKEFNDGFFNADVILRGLMEGTVKNYQEGKITKKQYEEEIATIQVGLDSAE